MFSSLILAALPLLALAAPAPEPDFLSALVKRASAPSTIAQCNVGAIKMNSSGLPAPSAGLVLDHIAIGRGTQNYTCGSNSSAAPVAVGAVATLFNVTCLAGPFTALLDVLPGVALKFPVPDSDAVLSPANLFLLGHHYFTNATTPFFNLNTSVADYGLMGCAKINTTNSAVPARDVANLKLATKTRDGCTIAEVYRLNGAGGQPPATCAGMPSAFQVQYAAEYWFWSNPSLGQYS